MEQPMFFFIGVYAKKRWLPVSTGTGGFCPGYNTAPKFRMQKILNTGTQSDAQIPGTL
jgi:hypothetical protein